MSDIARGGLRESTETRSIRGERGASTPLRREKRSISEPFQVLRHSTNRSSPGYPGVGAVVLWALAAALASGCGEAPEPVPERVVLVTIDTLRADRVGAYGSAEGHTPHLDDIAREGVRFDVALSPAPLTLPAHASLMTGLEPPAHGVRHNSIHRLGRDLPTLAERLRAAGHATAAFVGAVVLDRRFGLDRGFDTYDDHTAGRVSGATGYAERTADAVVDAAAAWLAGAPPRFFLWVHFYDPHAAYRPPVGFASAFPSDPYRGEIAFADAQLGRLLGIVRERWGDEGLLLVATSDHGESLGEHGEATHSYGVYEATQRVPLLLRGPGLPAGVVVEMPVSLLDVAPTILAWVGAEPLPAAVGRDLRELMQGDAPLRSLYMETLATQLDFGWSPLLALRAGRFKYIRAPRPELYDLEADPGETRDRAAQEPERVAALDAALERHLAAAPRAPESVALDEADRERLRSLGYVVASASLPSGQLGRVGGADPKDGAPLLRALALARLDLEEGRAERALARLDALPDAGSTLRAERAAAALSAGQPARAEREARALLAAEPARTDMRILLSRALAAQGREADADRALAGLPPDVAPAPWVALRAARAEDAAGRTRAARERLALARTRHPQDETLERAEAALAQGVAELEETLAAREAELAASPDDPAACNDVAWILARLERDLERALELALRAVAVRPEDPAVLDTLAAVHLARGEPQRALEAARRGLGRARGATRSHLLVLEAESIAAGASAAGSETPGDAPLGVP